MSAPVLLTLGGLVADLVLPIPALPVRAGEHQLGEWLRVEPGGLGNCLVVASRLGMRTAALGWLGDDLFGDHLVRVLEREGVDLTPLLRVAGPTATSVVLIDRTRAEHVFLGTFGASGPARVPPDWVERLGPEVWLLSDGYVLLRAAPLVEEAFALARARGARTAFDPGPLAHGAPQASLGRTLAQTTVLLLTEAEARAVIDRVGATSPDRLTPGTAVGAGAARRPEVLMQALRGLGPDVVAVKRGAAGAVVAGPQGTVAAEGFPVAVQDTTAAGDAFDAALLVALAFGADMQTAALLANATGALSVTRVGTGTALPTAAEVATFLETRGATLPAFLRRLTGVGGECAGPEVPWRAG
ncbi:MAG: carbohydrate kinase family protein [Armatimonadota bacterium]|nr:carbohydrate kinase family protein [Armatimonadota bacterium]MDR7448045.1 carbohydrate kinase family protein [Armatimonadota bacterium]MDR7459594.1 carbohydrate kinase family protein [Armatimonadota bacterium]MDR7478639.1 carbohydrate kinase family protein [Armatimonadota bacterium]MDR7488034.1 carbohydrate kinase family protein [Armatimonadota bacterium]